MSWVLVTLAHMLGAGRGLVRAEAERGLLGCSDLVTPLEQF